MGYNVVLYKVMNMKKTTKEIGDEGEDQACVFLQKAGYTLLQRNFRSGRNEIDIICQKDKLLIFVEVKRRKNNKFGYGEDFVDSDKMDRLQSVAETYIDLIDWRGDIRFDIIALTQSEIKHFQDV